MYDVKSLGENSLRVALQMHKHSWFPEDESEDPLTLPSSATMRLIILVLNKLSQQLQDGSDDEIRFRLSCPPQDELLTLVTL